jgi:hypothetical protein
MPSRALRPIQSGARSPALFAASADDFARSPIVALADGGGLCAGAFSR